MSCTLGPRLLDDKHGERPAAALQPVLRRFAQQHRTLGGFAVDDRVRGEVVRPVRSRVPQEQASGAARTSRTQGERKEHAIDMANIARASGTYWPPAALLRCSMPCSIPTSHAGRARDRRRVGQVLFQVVNAKQVTRPYGLPCSDAGAILRQIGNEPMATLAQRTQAVAERVDSLETILTRFMARTDESMARMDESMARTHNAVTRLARKDDRSRMRSSKRSTWGRGRCC